MKDLVRNARLLFCIIYLFVCLFITVNGAYCITSDSKRVVDARMTYSRPLILADATQATVNESRWWSENHEFLVQGSYDSWKTWKVMEC